ncbi:helix-turn-helix domain-containing protein [bacterium]|nr:helix-turn-helix domain-containing protein [bacterium]
MLEQKRIALDVAHLGFTENYRIGALSGVIKYARQHTSWQLLYNQKTLSLLHSFERFADLSTVKVDGVIFSYWDDRKLAEIRGLGVPMVSISNDHPIEPPVFATCGTDDVAVGHLAAEDLLERGFRHFAFYGDVAMYWEQQRWKGFREALGKRGFEALLIRTDYEAPAEATARAVGAELRALPHPLGVLTSSDTRGLHILEICRREGLAVPLDIAIIGVDNNHFLCEAPLPSLSSVEQDPERVGYEAAALLDRMIRDGVQLYDQLQFPPRRIATRMSSDITAVDHPALSRALLYIRDNLRESFSVDDVAAAASTSRSTLERLFQARLKTTVGHFLRHRRIALAKELLLQPELGLEEIAWRCGLRRATYLCGVFREATNMTPGEWRRQFFVGAGE